MIGREKRKGGGGREGRMGWMYAEMKLKAGLAPQISWVKKDAGLAPHISWVKKHNKNAGLAPQISWVKNKKSQQKSQQKRKQ